MWAMPSFYFNKAEPLRSLSVLAAFFYVATIVGITFLSGGFVDCEEKTKQESH